MLYLFLILCCLQALYWILLFIGLPKIEGSAFESKGVSIIITIKNEEANLSFLIDKLLAQEYPEFEVVIANDYSTDQSQAILDRYKASNQINSFIPSIDQKGKKLALTEAIEKSNFDLLLFTDGDCLPSSKHWIQSMVNHLREKDICIGYGPLTAQSTSGFFSKMETVWVAIQYFSFAYKGRPYMSVGRNWMYRKQVFINHNGFNSSKHIASGDDDLLLNEMATSTNVAVNIEPASWVFSPAENTWSGLFQQKRRHLASATEYKPSIKVLLSMFSGLHLSIYGVLLWGLFTPNWETYLLIIAVKYGIQFVINYRWAFKLESSVYAFLFPIIESLLALYYLCLTPFLWFFKKKTW